jgi:hypothetical protein
MISLGREICKKSGKIKKSNLVQSPTTLNCVGWIPSSFEAVLIQLIFIGSLSDSSSGVLIFP